MPKPLKKYATYIMSGLRLSDGQSVARFIVVRGMHAACLQRPVGLWSVAWAKAVLGWHRHLLQDQNCLTWGALAATLRSPTELQERRAFHRGRPGTRIQSGWVRKRWEDSLSDAEAYIDPM